MVEKKRKETPHSPFLSPFDLDSMSSSRSYIREVRFQVSTFRRRTFGKLEDVECCLGTLECEWVCVCVCVLVWLTLNGSTTPIWICHMLFISMCICDCVKWTRSMSNLGHLPISTQQ
jgi:hypothetical protein